MEPRVKTLFWVQAQVRLCDRDFIPIAVSRRGDPDSGSVLIVLRDRHAGHTVLSQAQTAGGGRAWVRGTGNTPVDPDTAWAYVERAVKRDSDVWVLEIEDRDNRYQPDGPVL